MSQTLAVKELLTKPPRDGIFTTDWYKYPYHWYQADVTTQSKNLIKDDYFIECEWMRKVSVSNSVLTWSWRTGKSFYTDLDLPKGIHLPLTGYTVTENGDFALEQGNVTHPLAFYGTMPLTIFGMSHVYNLRQNRQAVPLLLIPYHLTGRNKLLYTISTTNYQLCTMLPKQPVNFSYIRT